MNTEIELIFRAKIVVYLNLLKIDIIFVPKKNCGHFSTIHQRI